MNAENTNVLIKSEKTPQKKKKLIAWCVSILLIIVTLVALIIDYSAYKKGQKYGLAIEIATSEAAGYCWVDEDDSYAEQCEDVYNKLNSHTYDIRINGVTYDASDVRESEDAIRSAFADVMHSAGFDRYYGKYSIANWFKYTNIFTFSTEFFRHHSLLVYSCFLVFLFSVVYTVLVNREAKKELVVYEDSVLCRINPRKSKQLLFEDVNNIEFGKSFLKIVGTSVKFKISNLTNAESIKSVIIEKKKNAQAKAQVATFI